MRIYFVRNSIFNSIKKNIKYFKGDLLDIGCGKMPYKEYLLKNSDLNTYMGIDIETALIYDSNIKPDIIWDGVKIPIKDRKFNIILATEVLEHCPHPEIIFEEAYRLLEDGGILFTTTPFIFPLHESPHDEYRYTPYALERLGKESGFNKISIYPLGGINASIAQILSFWPKNKYTRLLIMPLVYLLNKTDKNPKKIEDDVFVRGLYSLFIK